MPPVCFGMKSVGLVHVIKASHRCVTHSLGISISKQILPKKKKSVFIILSERII